MNKLYAVGIDTGANIPIGLGPHARHLLDAAMALDLSQRRLLAAALRPGPSRDRGPGPSAPSQASRFSLRSDSAAAVARRALFAAPAWRQLWRPGIELHVYVLGTPGLQPVAVDLGLSLAKLGTCQVGQLDERIGRLRREGYGSVVRRGLEYLIEAGFDGWTPPPRLQLKAAPPFGPVRLSTASLIVTLPVGITHGMFESDLNQALRPIGLATFADSDAGRAWCAARGVDPHRLLRFTGDPARGVLEAATEIALFRPQADGPALAAVLEEIVIGYVGLRHAAPITADAA